jgi:hypothetical protein
VLVGYDTRFLADRFAAEAAAIFVRHGFPAQVSIRPVPTPVLAFEIVRSRAVGAVNFTASHNPPQYLGIKFSTSDGAPALPEVTRRIESEIATDSVQDEPAPATDALGRVERFDPVAAHLDDPPARSTPPRSAPSPHFSLDWASAPRRASRCRIEKTGAARPRPTRRRTCRFGGQSPQCGEPELRELVPDPLAPLLPGPRATAIKTASAVCDDTGAQAAHRSPRPAPGTGWPQGQGAAGTQRGHDARARRREEVRRALYETPYFGTSARLLAGEIGFGGESGPDGRGQNSREGRHPGGPAHGRACRGRGPTIAAHAAWDDRPRLTRRANPADFRAQKRPARQREDPPAWPGARSSGSAASTESS